MSSGIAPAPLPEGKTKNAAVETMSLLREIGLRSLSRMYSPKDKVFYFRLRRHGNTVVPEGLSPRYTAISLIGLATESPEVAQEVFGTHSMQDVLAHAVDRAAGSNNLGDVALTCWAARALNYEQTDAAWARMRQLQPESAVQPTVEVAWSLVAMCVAPERATDSLRSAVAGRLMNGLTRATGVNPHVLGASNSRSHVACFADQVYPIHALSLYSTLSGNREALHDAARCADMICRLQGDAGQWWWHYDVRTGRVVEGYPVYAIHQDAMGPMALFALRNAGGPDFIEHINRGVSWMDAAPELNGGTVVDRGADLIWRKVARREPGKTSRYLQAAASKIHRSMRVPGMNLMFPPSIIDYEDRPYHIGWMLYAMHLAGKTWQQE